MTTAQPFGQAPKSLPKSDFSLIKTLLAVFFLEGGFHPNFVYLTRTKYTWSMEYPPIIDNSAEKRYEMHVNGLVPRIEYIMAKDKIYLTHTEVPKELEGKGIASALVKKVLEDVERRNLTLIPMCPFVAAYIKRHPEWKKLVLRGINIQ